MRPHTRLAYLRAQVYVADMHHTAPSHRLDELIRERGVVAKRVAERCGVDPGTVRRWRRGESAIPAHQIPQLAAFFDVTPEHLMRWSEPEPNGPTFKAVA